MSAIKRSRLRSGTKPATSVKSHPGSSEAKAKFDPPNADPRVSEACLGPGGSLAALTPKILYAANVASFFDKFLMPYAEHFKAHGWQVDAISKGFAQHKEVDFAGTFNHLWEVDWARKPHELRHVSRIINHIREIATTTGYDIVHVHTPVAAMMMRFALRHRDRQRTKLLYTAHGFHFFEGAARVSSAVYRRLENVASRWTDYLVVMNEEDYKAAQSLKGLCASRIVHMPGIGLDLAHYTPSSALTSESRSEFGFEDDAVVFLVVAEFISRKRQSDVLEALALQEDSRAKVVFAGDGQTLDNMKRLAGQLGVTDRVRFLGWRRDIPNLLAASDCFVLPSEQEGLPRSIMEALSCGVPVIATDIRGNRDLLANGVGSLYPAGNITALAGALKDFLANPGRHRTSTVAGIMHAQRYDIRNLMQMHESLYATALGVDRESLMARGGRGYLS